VSAIKFAFIVVSNGLSHANEGERFTSRSHGFNSESRRMSYPKTSKQLLRCN